VGWGGVACPLVPAGFTPLHDSHEYKELETFFLRKILTRAGFKMFCRPSSSFDRRTASQSLLLGQLIIHKFVVY